MTPAARTQAAIELLDQIVVAARDNGAAADTLIARYFAARRYAGSKDRRAVRALVFEAIRALGERPASGRAAMVALAQATPEVADTFDGSGHGPAPLADGEPVAARGIAPAWMVAALTRSGLNERELAALMTRAPLDIRVNLLKGEAGAVAAGFDGAQPIPFLADGLRLPPDTQVESSDVFAAGLIEVQDAGSQAVTHAAQAQPGMTVVDLCAGAGGKTLALAGVMANSGRLIACDVDRARLSRLAPRAARAGVSIVETRLLDPRREVDALGDLAATADIVLVDAPCSGTGTWRRNPEAKWRLTPDRLDRLAATQAMLLDLAAPLVRRGGALVHIVCSLLDAEGAGQVASFLSRHPGWRAEAIDLGVGRRHGDGLRLTPATDGTDGFFVARLIAP